MSPIDLDVGLDQEIDEEYNNGLFIGTRRAVAALYDADVDDNKIIEMINKHFKIPRDEAKNLLRGEKIEAVVRATLTHLELQGYSSDQAWSFIDTNHVKQELRCNHELLTLRRDPAKLIKHIERNKKIKQTLAE